MSRGNVSLTPEADRMIRVLYSKPEGIEQSYYARQQRGELSDTYLY
jgi:hypothetical protein